MRFCLAAFLCTACGRIAFDPTDPVDALPDLGPPRVFGAAGSQTGERLDIADDGSVVVAGEFETSIDLGSSPLANRGGYDVVVAKLTSQGSLVWQIVVGGPADDEIRGLSRDAAGNVYISGRYQGTVDFGGGSGTAQGSTPTS